MKIYVNNRRLFVMTSEIDFITQKLKETKIDNDSNDIEDMLRTIVEETYNKKVKKNIWEESNWKHIAELVNDEVGKVGERFIQSLCDRCGIEAIIDGLKTKKRGGGEGDGFIKGSTVEIKTARAGSNKPVSFQHELGEKPWMAAYMIFVDIGPSVFYVTIFPNFTEDKYKSSCFCKPFFPTRSFCWRKGSGCFKLDTTESLNLKQSKNKEPNTLSWSKNTNMDDIKMFINRIII